MKAKDYEFTIREIQNIEIHRDKQNDIRAKLKFIAMLLLVKNDVCYVASIIGRDPRTIENWFQKYLAGGIDALATDNYKPKKPMLDICQENQVVIWTSFNNPDTVKEVVSYISEKFGIEYCHENVRQLLIKRGLKHIRPREVPGNPPSLEEQRRFIGEYHRTKAVSEPGTKVLFGDAMHLVHQNVKGFCWGYPVSPRSRKRIRVEND